VPDSLGFLDAVGGLPEQLADAHRSARATLERAPLPSPDEIDHVVVLGMGGSGIAGDVLAAAANATLAVPVVVLKQLRVPRFVGPRTLSFAVSYSGDTDEALQMAASALDAGARVVAISRGGALEALAREHEAVHVPCPDGYLPRAAVGALLTPLFVTLERIGLLPDAGEWLDQAGRQLAARREKCLPSVEAPANPAREIARRIGTTIPILYGGGALGAVAAQRWKCDVNENAKAPAFWNAYPELDHNEICGWGQHGDVTRQVLTLVELHHGFAHARLIDHSAATRALVEEAVVQILEVEARGEGRLAQLLDLIYLGDWTSAYLALDSDVDPGPIDAIAQLKAMLGGTHAG
jgi:glucose/mannose-6-phosphate isomerase